MWLYSSRLLHRIVTVISCLPLYVGQGLGDAAIAPQFAYTHSTHTLSNRQWRKVWNTWNQAYIIRPYIFRHMHASTHTCTTLYQKTLENTQWRKQMQSGLGDDAANKHPPPQNGEFLKCLVAEIFLKLWMIKTFSAQQYFCTWRVGVHSFKDSRRLIFLTSKKCIAFFISLNL